jgi:hypothetical protein
MLGKITLITPPDIFENENVSVLFVNITDDEQDSISRWFANSDFSDNINFYLYNGEPNVTWFLYALSRCEHKYINMDCVNYITQALGGYTLSKNGVYYKTDDANLASVYSHINNNRVDQIENFLESILGAKERQSS